MKNAMIYIIIDIIYYSVKGKFWIALGKHSGTSSSAQFRIYVKGGKK